MTRASRQTSRGLSLLIKPENVEASLWRRLREDNEITCRADLFERYQPFAKSMARQLYRTRPNYGLSISDFEQLAYTGLLEAIDRFEVRKGTPFKGYARHRIRGSIIDGLARATEASSQYTFQRRQELERIASIKKGLKSTESAVEQTASVAIGLALGFLLENAGFACSQSTKDPMPTAYETLAMKEMQETLIVHVEALPNPQDQIIAKHYFKGISFSDIAKMLSLSKGRISQLHRAALARLQKYLKQFR